MAESSQYISTIKHEQKKSFVLYRWGEREKVSIALTSHMNENKPCVCVCGDCKSAECRNVFIFISTQLV
jgi:hypothetical protein